jgi:hypothetical protein
MIKTDDVIVRLFNLFVFRGIPEYIPSDNGPEFTTRAERQVTQIKQNHHQWQVGQTGSEGSRTE